MNRRELIHELKKLDGVANVRTDEDNAININLDTPDTTVTLEYESNGTLWVDYYSSCVAKKRTCEQVLGMVKLLTDQPVTNCNHLNNKIWCCCPYCDRSHWAPAGDPVCKKCKDRHEQIDKESNKAPKIKN